MTTLQLLILDCWNQYINFLIAHIFLFSILIFIILSIFSFLLARILNKYHQRLKSKFLVYLLNNSWISILAQNLELSIKLSHCKYSTIKSEPIIDHNQNNLFCNLKHKLGVILKNFSNFINIAECKNYFRFR